MKKVLLKVLRALSVQFLMVATFSGIIFFVMPLMPMFNDKNTSFKGVLSENMDAFLFFTVTLSLIGLAETLYTFKKEAKQEPSAKLGDG